MLLHLLQVTLACKDMTQNHRITVLDRTSSVLDDAWKKIADDGLSVFDAIVSLEQTAGRGQYGREWISPKGNVYAAIRLPAVAPFDNLEAALALSCCIATTLSHFGFDAKIKWMNDLVINGGKVAGILLEQKGDRLVAGIGINVMSCPDTNKLRYSAALPATCLYHVDPDRASQLTPEIIVKELVIHLETLDLDWFSKQWRTEALSRLLWLNEAVCLDVDEETVTGVLAGIDHHGALLLATPNGIRSCVRGTVRKA